MPIIDLTREFIGERFPAEVRREEIRLKSADTAYTGVVYTIVHDGMSGSYIDFPGHIAETADGICADNCPPESVYRIPASVIHLNFRSGDGAVSAADLEAAFGGKIRTEALIVNALAAPHDPFDIDLRSVYLDNSAIQWIIDSGCKMLVSDIFESKALHGVFLKLFAAGIKTVCMPVNLYKITVPEVLLTVLFAKMPGVVQLPCRIIAEV